MMRGNAFKDLERLAVEQGWRIEFTASKHVRWLAPNGGIVISSSTPSDRRALKNHLTLMRRNGFLGR